MYLLGLISSYREGTLIQHAARSLLSACDHVIVCDGPVGATPTEAGEPSDLGRWRRDPRLTWIERDGTTDADKRTRVLEYAQGRFKDRPLWGFWLDADETLLWPELLRLYAEAAPPEVGGIPIPKVELAGTTVMAHSRFMRLELIERYVMGTFQLQLVGRETVLSLPDIPPAMPQALAEATGLVNSGAWDLGSDAYRLAGALKRLCAYLTFVQTAPPGTPQILHLAPFRPDVRRESRLSEPEADWVKEKTRELGIVLPDDPLGGKL